MNLIHHSLSTERKSTVVDPLKAFEVFQELGAQTTRNYANRYNAAHPGTVADEEDFESHVWTHLWEWLQNPDNLAQADCLLNDREHARRWINQYARARMCDLIDVVLAGTRDQRLTFHASRSANDDDSYLSDMTFFDLATYESGHCSQDSGYRALVIEEIFDELQNMPDASKLFEALLQQPKCLREAFYEKRMHTCRGEVELLDNVDVVLHLKPTAGYAKEETWITLADRLPTRDAHLETDRGPVRVRVMNNRWDLNWAETHLEATLSQRTQTGKFNWRLIRPSPRIFDEKPMATFLNMSRFALRNAWPQLRSAVAKVMGWTKTTP